MSIKNMTYTIWLRLLKKEINHSIFMIEFVDILVTKF